MTVMTYTETERLAAQEQLIERGAGAVAEALGVIRDERLYRNEYPTFEDYCRGRWGMSRQHVNRQIIAAEVAAALEPIGSKIPEGQARELADLRHDPERLREVYQNASEASGGHVTAAAIRLVRQDPGPGGGLDRTTTSGPIGPSDTGGRFQPSPPADRPTSEPAKPRRKPLFDAFSTATYDLERVVERINRLVNDDRWPQNAEKVAAVRRNDLLRARDLLEQVLQQVPETELPNWNEVTS